MRIATKILCLVALFVGSLAGTSYGQGITTSAMTGLVKSKSGEELPGATVLAIHTPSGTRYGNATRIDGRFTIQGMRVGGPYTVTISYVGFETSTYEDIYLTLGQTYRLDAVLAESGTELTGVEVTASRNSEIDPNRTGAETNISNENIQALPTISRGLSDFTRVTPQATLAGGGTSFAGQNNRYNQFAIDGTVNNDVFGLAGSGTNGGQTGVQPISLDAIQEVQVVLAPYDVRLGGFTGGGINAITRSGDNTTRASAYFFGNNQNITGKSIDAERTPLDDYSDYQVGARVGGALVKDKLFFFLNGEITSRTTPLLFRPGTELSRVTVEEVERAAAVAEGFGYDPGSFGAINDERNSDKLFARLDYNINQNHKITLRHSYVYGEELDNGRTPTTVRFFNNGYYFPSKTNSSVLEWNGIFGNSISNELRIGYTTVRDDREAIGNPFPYVNILLGGGRRIQLGSEPFSVANQLDQDVLTFTNNFTLYKGEHTITLGTHNEFYNTYNLFIRENYGAYTFASLEDWESQGGANPAAPEEFNYSYSLTDNPQQGAEFSAFQLGLYAQDQWQVKDELRVTYGVRVDAPTFNQNPTVNPLFNQQFADRNVATDQIPGMQFLVSPRVGVNWNPNGNQKIQVRGGIGLFTGRVPFVWLSNQYTNTGVEFGRVRLNQVQIDTIAAFDGFRPDPFNQQISDSLGLGNTSEVNITDENFKFPQVLRINGALDYELAPGVVATFEAIFTKNLRNIAYENLNIGVIDTLAGADNRLLYGDRISDNFNDVLLLTNTNEGYSYSLTAQIQRKAKNGLVSLAALTYGESKDLFGGTSSQALSNWIFTPNVNGSNNAQLSYANYDVRWRAVAALGWSFDYKNGSNTTISAFYNGQSGIPYSYLVDGDLNGDFEDENDLIYIPRNSSEIQFFGSEEEQAAQWAAFDEYIEQSDYLSKNRGSYAERNGARLPWTNQLDVRVMHTFKLNTTDGNDHALQVSVDIFNFGALLSRKWGRQYSIDDNSAYILDFNPDNTIVDPESGNPIPRYTFSGSGLNDGKPYFVDDFFSRWRGQIGIRYLFN